MYFIPPFLIVKYCHGNYQVCFIKMLLFFFRYNLKCASHIFSIHSCECLPTQARWNLAGGMCQRWRLPLCQWRERTHERVWRQWRGVVGVGMDIVFLPVRGLTHRGWRLVLAGSCLITSSHPKAPLPPAPLWARESLHKLPLTHCSLFQAGTKTTTIQDW